MNHFTVKQIAPIAVAGLLRLALFRLSEDIVVRSTRNCLRLVPARLSAPSPKGIGRGH